MNASSKTGNFAKNQSTIDLVSTLSTTVDRIEKMSIVSITESIMLTPVD